MLPFLAIFVGLALGLPLLISIVARFEKRMVWPYGDPQQQPSCTDSSGYGQMRVGEAVQSGFRFLGWCPHIKGGKYQTSYGFLISRDRECLVVVSIGAMYGITVRSTTIYTPTADGRMLITTDKQSAIDVDLLREWRSQLYSARTFPLLVERHRDLLRRDGAVTELFTAGQEIEILKELRARHTEATARRGFVIFDESGQWCRYTWWGALKWAYLNHFIGLLRGFTGGYLPRVA